MSRALFGRIAIKLKPPRWLVRGTILAAIAATFAVPAMYYQQRTDAVTEMRMLGERINLTVDRLNRTKALSNESAALFESLERSLDEWSILFPEDRADVEEYRQTVRDEHLFNERMETYKENAELLWDTLVSQQPPYTSEEQLQTLDRILTNLHLVESGLDERAVLVPQHRKALLQHKDEVREFIVLVNFWREFYQDEQVLGGLLRRLEAAPSDEDAVQDILKHWDAVEDRLDRWSTTAPADLRADIDSYKKAIQRWKQDHRTISRKLQ